MPLHLTDVLNTLIKRLVGFFGRPSAHHVLLFCVSFSPPPNIVGLLAGSLAGLLVCWFVMLSLGRPFDTHAVFLSHIHIDPTKGHHNTREPFHGNSTAIMSPVYGNTARQHNTNNVADNRKPAWL